MKCHPFVLLREITTITVTLVYIYLQANAKEVLIVLSEAISKQELAHSEGVFIIIIIIGF